MLETNQNSQLLEALNPQEGSGHYAISFLVKGENISLVAELPIRSLGRVRRPVRQARGCHNTILDHGWVEEDRPELPSRDVQSLMVR